MKKIIAILLAAAILIVFAACSNSQNTDDTTVDTQSEVVQDADFSKTAGLWRLDDATDTASISMDGEGNFSAYYADGALEMSGYLECVEEYEGSNGRYDMYDASGELFNSFYMDSDTQLHFGNSEGAVYIKASDDTDDMPEIGVLLPQTRFTGLTAVESNSDFHGGYYYADQTQDGLTTIISSGFVNDIGTDEIIEDYVARCVELVCGTQYRELEMTETTLDFYPAYKMTWFTGENEDTRQWTGLFVLTDAYTYIYAFDTAADHAAEMQDTWNETLDGLTLVFYGSAE